MKHLQRDRWMRRTSTGKWMLKRVSTTHEAQFPRNYREALRDHGAVRVVTMLRDRGYSLSEAWETLKRMCNE